MAGVEAAFHSFSVGSLRAACKCLPELLSWLIWSEIHAAPPSHKHGPSQIQTSRAVATGKQSSCNSAVRAGVGARAATAGRTGAVGAGPARRVAS